MKRSRDVKLRRKQLENFRLWCVNVGFPPAQLIRVMRDRVLFEWTNEIETWCNEWMDRSDAAIRDHRPFGPSPTAVYGWRERVPFLAAQIVKHRIRRGEWDVDVGNPAQGLLPLLVHGGEYLWHRIPKIFGGPKRFTGPFLVARLWRRTRGWAV